VILDNTPNPSKQRKPKSAHALDKNILTFVRYVIANPDVDKLNKVDFETEMGIPVTSVNYLIKKLKAKGLLSTVGIKGKQYYQPSPLREQALLGIRRMGKAIGNRANEKCIVRETKSTSNKEGSKKEHTQLY
jgi:hypothetical protein